MNYQAETIEALSRKLVSVIEGSGGALEMIEAAAGIIPVTAAFSVVNRLGQPPIYLGDSFPAGPAKEAVQRYVSSTYLLNPVYNAFLSGLAPGLHRMIDLAPDNWRPDSAEVLMDDTEEIGFRTPGWPTGLQELVLATDLPGGAMGEISFSHIGSQGGYDEQAIGRLRPFLPLFDLAFQRLWARRSEDPRQGAAAKRLEDFGRDTLSPRESQVVQMILKGHSSLSIGLCLDIALPTVKTHRRNAYAKLGISTQQQLFDAFLKWQASWGDQALATAGSN